MLTWGKQHSAFWILQSVFVYLSNRKPLDSFAMHLVLEAQRRCLDESIR
jgi:hypothetical protein